MWHFNASNIQYELCYTFDMPTFLNLRDNAIGYINGTLVLASTATSLTIAWYLYPTNITLWIWAALVGILAPLSRSGTTKRQQLLYLIEHGIYTLLAINFTAIVLAYTAPLQLVFFTLLLYCFYIIPGLRAGALIMGIYLTVYAVFIWSLYTQHVFNAVNITGYLVSQSLGASISIVSSLVFLLLLPTANIPTQAKIIDRYLYVRALRVAIAINIAILIAKYYLIHENSAWICFSILIVIQQSLGPTIEKAMNRLIGTLLGILMGFLITWYFAPSHLMVIISSLIFLFFGTVAANKNYAWALFFITLLLVNSFYILQPANVTVHQFMLERVIDTFIGIAIALSCEILIFPKSFAEAFKRALCELFVDMEHMLNCITHRLDDFNVVEEDTRTHLEEVLQYRQLARYEPSVMFLRRFRFYNKLVPILFNINNEIVQLYKESASSIRHPDDFAMLQFTAAMFKVLQQVKYTHKASHRLVAQQIQEYKQSLAKWKHLSPRHVTLSILLADMLQLYGKIYR